MKKRHRWSYQLPHHATCERCGLIRRQVWYPGGRGVSGYYRSAPEGESFVSSRAPACEPVVDPRSLGDFGPGRPPN